MLQATALTVCDDFNLTGDNFRAAFVAHTTAMPELVGQEMRRVALRPTAAGKVGGALLGRLKLLSNYLNGVVDAGATATERADLLCRYNAAFNQTVNALPAPGMNNSVPGFHLSMLKALLDELYDTGMNAAPSFIAYRTAIPDACLAMLRMREHLLDTGGSGTTTHLMIHFFHQNMLPFDQIQARNVQELDRLRRSVPPNTPFQGFPQWGVGNAADHTATTNLRNHFMKHVLDADPAAELDWKDELRLWWVELGIVLRRGDASTWLGIGYPAVDSRFSVGSSVANDDTALPSAQVLPFLGTLRTGGLMTDRLKNELYAAYGTVYRDRALQAGRNLTQAMVHATAGDSTTVYVSGADGNIFVVGRTEGPVLGISSCYYMSNPVAKLGARVQIWPLP